MSSSWNQSDLDSILESLRNQRRRTTSGSFSENERHLYARDEITRLMNHCEALKQAVEVKRVSKSADDRLLLTAVQTACDAAALALIVNGIQQDFESGIQLHDQLFREKFEKDTTQPLSPLDACVLSLVSCLDSPLFCQMKEAEVERVVKSASARLVVIASLRYFERQSAHKKEGEENLRYYAVHLKVRHFNDEVERVRSLADVLQRFINLNNRVPFFSDQGSEGFNIDQEAGDSQVSSEVLDVMREKGFFGPSVFLPIAILAKGLRTIAERFQDITTSLLSVAPDHEISFAEYEEEVAEKQTAKDQAAGKKSSESDKRKQTKGGEKEGSKEKTKSFEDEEKARKSRLGGARIKRDAAMIGLFEDLQHLYLALIEVLSSALPLLVPASLPDAGHERFEIFELSGSSFVLDIIAASAGYSSNAEERVSDLISKEKNLEDEPSLSRFLKKKQSIWLPTLRLLSQAASFCHPNETSAKYLVLSLKRMLFQSSNDSSSESSVLMDKIPQYLHSGCIISSRGLVKRVGELIKKDDQNPLQLHEGSAEISKKAADYRIQPTSTLLSFLIKVITDEMGSIESIPWNTIQTLLNSAEVLFSMVTQIVKSERQDKISPEFSHSLLVIHRNVVTSILRPLTLTVSNALQLCKDATTSPDDQIKILKISESILDCIDLALLTSIDSLLDPDQDKAAKRGHISFEARLLVSCQLDYLLSELISSSLSLTDDSEAHDGVYKVVTKASSLSLRISGLVMTQPPSSLSPSPSDVDIDRHLVNGWWSYHLCQSQLIPAMAQAVSLPVDKGRTLRPSLQALLVSLYIQILPLATMLIQIETRMKLAPLLLPNEVLSFASAVEKLSSAAKAAISPCSKDSYKTDYDLMNALRSVSGHIASLFSVGGGPLSIEWSALKYNNPVQPLWPSFLDRAWGQKAMLSSSSSSSDHLTHHFFKIKDPLIEQAINQCNERASKPALCASIPADNACQSKICSAGTEKCGSLFFTDGDDRFSLCTRCGSHACAGCSSAGWCEQDNHNCTMLEQLREMSIGSMDERLQEILRQIEGTDNDYYADQAFALQLKGLGVTSGGLVKTFSLRVVQRLRRSSKMKKVEKLLSDISQGMENDIAVRELARLVKSKGMEDIKSKVVHNLKEALSRRSQNKILKQARSQLEERMKEFELCQAKGEDSRILGRFSFEAGEVLFLTEADKSYLRLKNPEAGAVKVARLMEEEDELLNLFLQHVDIYSPTIDEASSSGSDDELEMALKKTKSEAKTDSEFKAAKWDSLLIDNDDDDDDDDDDYVDLLARLEAQKFEVYGEIQAMRKDEGSDVGSSINSQGQLILPLLRAKIEKIEKIEKHIRELESKAREDESLLQEDFRRETYFLEDFRRRGTLSPPPCDPLDFDYEMEGNSEHSTDEYAYLANALIDRIPGSENVEQEPDEHVVEDGKEVNIRGGGASSEAQLQDHDQDLAMDVKSDHGSHQWQEYQDGSDLSLD